MLRRDSDDVSERSEEIEELEDSCSEMESCESMNEENDYYEEDEDWEHDDRERLKAYQRMKKKCDQILMEGDLYEDADFEGDAALWKDDEFPHPDAGNLQKGWKNSNNVWKRIKDISPNAKLFAKGISPTDIGQGSLGNCAFMASLAALAENPDRVRMLIHN
jgi:hypothetical protein